MLIVTQTAPPVEGLVPEEVKSPGIALSLWTALFNRILLVHDPGLDEVKAAILRDRPELAGVFADALSKTIISTKAGEPADFAVTPPVSAAEYLTSPRFIESAERRSPVAVIGETRESYYDRAYRHLFARAISVEVFDRYALTNMLRHDSWVNWLLRERWSRTPIKVMIHSVLPKNESPSGHRMSPLEAAEKARETLALDQTHHEFSAQIMVHPHRAKTQHDRFVRIRFDRNSLNFESSNGLSMFDERVIPEAYTPHQISTEAYWQKEKKLALNCR